MEKNLLLLSLLVVLAAVWVVLLVFLLRGCMPAEPAWSIDPGSSSGGKQSDSDRRQPGFPHGLSESTKQGAGSQKGQHSGSGTAGANGAPWGSEGSGGTAEDGRPGALGKSVPQGEWPGKGGNHWPEGKPAGGFGQEGAEAQEGKKTALNQGQRGDLSPGTDGEESPTEGPRGGKGGLGPGLGQRSSDPSEIAQVYQRAQRHARQAKQLAQQGQYGRAFQEALRAWQLLRPAAKQDLKCKNLHDQLEQMLREYGEFANQKYRLQPLDDKPLAVENRK